MNYEQFTDILAIILAVLLIICLFVWALIIIYYQIKTDNLRQDHIKNLNEHDKAVIMDYQNTKYTFRRRKRNNMKSNE